MQACARVGFTSLRLSGRGLAQILNPGSRVGSKIFKVESRQISVLSSHADNSFNFEHKKNVTALSPQRPLSTQVAELKAVPKDRDEELILLLPDGSSIEFSYVWLRDSCLCPECHEPSAKSRLLRMQDLPVDCRPANIEVCMT